MAEDVTLKRLQELCFACREVDVELDKLKEQSKELNADKAELRKQILEYLDDNSLTRFDFGDGKVSVSERASVKLADKFKFFDWLKGQGTFEDVATVHSATLNSIYKKEKEQAIEEGRIEFLAEGLPGLSEPQVFRDIRFYKR